MKFEALAHSREYKAMAHVRIELVKCTSKERNIQFSKEVQNKSLQEFTSEWVSLIHI